MKTFDKNGVITEVAMHMVRSLTAEQRKLMIYALAGGYTFEEAYNIAMEYDLGKAQQKKGA